ncbi:MAG: aminotransferase class IV [Candidatus Limnocylindrales bacterium]
MNGGAGDPAESGSGDPAERWRAAEELPRVGHVWADGLLVPVGTPLLAATDRGFQLGDGVFETIRVVAGRILELPLHAERLRASAQALEIPVPADVEETLRIAIAELLAADNLVSPGLVVSIRATLSRGPVEGRALLPPAVVHPTLVVQAALVAPPPEEMLVRGLRLATSSVRRDPASPLGAVKTTSRAEFVYARLEARRKGADDALFLTVDGHLAEATSASIFLVRGGRLTRANRDAPAPVPATPAPAPPLPVLATPALACGILAGTTRQWLLQWAERSGLAIREDWLTPDELFAADEVFLASSVAGVLPVTGVDGRPIGDGRPGRWTLRARAEREAFARDGE